MISGETKVLKRGNLFAAEHCGRWLAVNRISTKRVHFISGKQMETSGRCWPDVPLSGIACRASANSPKAFVALSPLRSRFYISSFSLATRSNLITSGRVTGNTFMARSHEIPARSKYLSVIFLSVFQCYNNRERIKRMRKAFEQGSAAFRSFKPRVRYFASSSI